MAVRNAMVSSSIMYVMMSSNLRISLPDKDLIIVSFRWNYKCFSILNIIIVKMNDRILSTIVRVKKKTRNCLMNLCKWAWMLIYHVSIVFTLNFDLDWVWDEWNWSNKLSLVILWIINWPVKYILVAWVEV